MLYHMVSPADPPPHEAIAEDLARVRSSGLVRLRHASVPSLRQSAGLAGYPVDAEGTPAAVEAMLRRAVARLGGGRLEEAAGYTYGLVQGTRDWPAADRRKKSAEVYRVSVDRFRKHYERIVHGQTAEAVIGLIQESARSGAVTPDPEPPVVAGADWETVTRPLSFRQGGVSIPISVHCTSVDLLRDVDVVVCPLNTYLELASTYKTSVAACLRWAGAQRSPTGEIVVDGVSNELDRWRAQHARPGLAVAPGTVVPTAVDPAGDLRFRRIYHAAVASPRAGTNDYHVDPAAIARAVHHVFSIAREERDAFIPPLASLGFPLLGAGRGGLAPRTSFAWIWEAVLAECLAEPSWQIHFVTIGRPEADLILETLRGLGAAELPPEPEPAEGPGHRPDPSVATDHRAD